MYGLELMIIIFATMAQALTSASPAMSVVGLLIFWRVLMGIVSSRIEILISKAN